MFLVEIKNSTRSRRIKFLFFKEFYYLPFFRETMITKRSCNMFPFKPDKTPINSTVFTTLGKGEESLKASRV